MANNPQLDVVVKIKGTEEAERELKELEKVGTETAQAVERDWKQVSQRFEEMGGKVAQVGGVLTQNVTVPILGLGAAAVAMSLDVLKSEEAIASLSTEGQASARALQGAITSLQGEFTLFKGEVAESVMPTITNLIDTALIPLLEKVTTLVDAWGRQSDAVKNTQLAFLGIAAASGPLMTFAGQTIQTVGSMIFIWNSLKDSVIAAKIAMITPAASVGTITGAGIVAGAAIYGTSLYQNITMQDEIQAGRERRMGPLSPTGSAENMYGRGGNTTGGGSMTDIINQHYGYGSYADTSIGPEYDPLNAEKMRQLDWSTQAKLMAFGMLGGGGGGGIGGGSTGSMVPNYLDIRTPQLNGYADTGQFFSQDAFTLRGGGNDSFMPGGSILGGGPRDGFAPSIPSGYYMGQNGKMIPIHKPKTATDDGGAWYDSLMSNDFLMNAGMQVAGTIAGGGKFGIGQALPLIGSAFGPVGGAIGGLLGGLFGKKQKGDTPQNPVHVKVINPGDLATAMLNVTKTLLSQAGAQGMNDLVKQVHDQSLARNLS